MRGRLTHEDHMALLRDLEHLLETMGQEAAHRSRECYRGGDYGGSLYWDGRRDLCTSLRGILRDMRSTL